MTGKASGLLRCLDDLAADAKLQKHGWDSYDAAPVNLELLSEVRDWVEKHGALLEAIPCDRLYAFPTPQGGVMIEDAGKLGDPCSFFIEWTPQEGGE